MNPRTISILMAAALAIVGFSGARATQSETSQMYLLRYQGRERTYRVYRPAGLSRVRAVPLVVMLHGGFGSGAQAESSYGWDQLAAREGFVVAYPDGIARAWNAGTCCGKPQSQHVDDVGFLSEMVRTIVADQHVDPRRIAVTGMSNGAMMAYRMGCESSVGLAAIGSVSGTMLVPCRGARPLRVMEIHGLADQNVPFSGGTGAGTARVQTPPLAQVVHQWAQIDHCGAPGSVTSGVVTNKRYACPGDLAVSLITIAGAGHQWPDSKPPSPTFESIAQALNVRGLDPPSTALNATQTLYAFFFGGR